VIRDVFRKFQGLSAKEVGRRAVSYVRRRFVRYLERVRDYSGETYASKVPAEALGRYLDRPEVSLLHDFRRQIAETCACFLEHRFDLLGSGWVQVRHGMRCLGMGPHQYSSFGKSFVADSQGQWLVGRVNSKNLRESCRIWALVDPGYTPIDWQLDFKSGFRWSERQWAQDVPIGHLPGVDVKVPWELARLQHLPQLAIARACALGNGEDSYFKHPDTYAREFRNVVLDFTAANPPRFGVNWRSAMDAAIRAANILVAYDLFRASGTSFDPEFETILKRSMVEHGEYIAEHFGWEHQPRGNHYLAHLTGLLFIGAYLPISAVSDTWLVLGMQELLSEVRRQFHPDGSNFEGSTSYHRLSGEMVVYATALLAGLPQNKREAMNRCRHRPVKTSPKLNPALWVTEPGEMGALWPFPAWYGERIKKMAEFTRNITKPSGEIVQVGDNDSGRLFRLFPCYTLCTEDQAKERYKNLVGFEGWPGARSWWDENILDHRHLISATAGLLDRQDFRDFASCTFEGRVIEGLAKGGVFKTNQDTGFCEGRAFNVTDGKMPLPENAERFELVLHYPGKDLREGLERFAYPDFGLYVFRSDRVFLSVRCGPLGQEGRGGHAHNDQLSLELEVDEEAVFSDPGSFIYTPLPETRNRYRSDCAHAGFRSTQRESARLDLGLFEIHGDPKGKCLFFGEVSFVGRHTGFGTPVLRSVRIEANSVRIEDGVVQLPDFSVYPFYAHPDQAKEVHFSPGYGKMSQGKLTVEINP